MTECPRYRRHRLNGKIHLVGSGCKYLHGRWTAPWPEVDCLAWPEIIDYLEEQSSLTDDPFCYFCFGRAPFIEIHNPDRKTHQ